MSGQLQCKQTGKRSKPKCVIEISDPSQIWLASTQFSWVRGLLASHVHWHVMPSPRYGFCMQCTALLSEGLRINLPGTQTKMLRDAALSTLKRYLGRFEYAVFSVALLSVEAAGWKFCWNRPLAIRGLWCPEDWKASIKCATLLPCPPIKAAQQLNLIHQWQVDFEWFRKMLAKGFLLGWFGYM